jgi:hypothetical protein
MSPDIYSEAKVAPELMRERGGVAPGSSLKPTLFQYTKLCLLKMNVMVLQEKKFFFSAYFIFVCLQKRMNVETNANHQPTPTPRKTVSLTTNYKHPAFECGVGSGAAIN